MKPAQKFLLSLFTFLFLLGMPQRAFSQFGFKAGYSISNFYYTNADLNPQLGLDIDLTPYLGYDIEWAQLGTQKADFSPLLSCYYQMKLSNKFGFRPELLYSQKGVNFSQFEYERLIYKVKISYLELPVSLAWAFRQRENLVGELYLGAYGALQFNAIKKVATLDASPEKIDLPSVEQWDGGAHLGINIKRKISNHFFLFDLRVFLGLNDIFYLPEDWTSSYHDTQKTKLTGIQIAIGYEL